MYSKISTYGTHYIQFLTPFTIKKKCLRPCVVNFKLCFPEHKISYIKSIFFSTYEGPPRHQSSKCPKNEFDSEDKIRLQNWIDLMKKQGGRIPKKITDEQVLELLSLPSDSSRRNCLKFFFKKECAQFNDVARKERKKELIRQRREEIDKRPKGHIEYGLWNNTMFTKTNKHQYKNLQNYRLTNAMMFNQSVVIDMDYYDHMERREISSLTEQISFCITDNKSSLDPFNLTMCNVDFECKKFQSVLKHMPNIIQTYFPMNVTSKSYLDIFPKEKLVYLTPHARDEMTEFDHEAIYILGGFVNLRDSTPISLTKAQKENIKAMKLPLDRYLLFKGKKELNIAVMVNILLELRKTGDWKKAFEHIPKRLVQKFL